MRDFFCRVYNSFLSSTQLYGRSRLRQCSGVLLVHFLNHRGTFEMLSHTLLPILIFLMLLQPEDLWQAFENASGIANLTSYMAGYTSQV